MFARAAWLSLAVAAFSCSVYDESLRQDSSVTPNAGAAEGGGGNASAGSVAGGVAGSSAAGANTAAGGDLGDAGTPGAAGDFDQAGAANGGGAGAPKGGTGGIGGTAGTAGSKANGGSSGRAGAGGNGAGGNGAGGNGAGGKGGNSSGGNGGTSASGGTAGSGPIVELGLAKPTTSSSQQSANPSSSGNDGQTATRWSASTATLPQWWRVDLGMDHTLSKVTVKFEFADRKYTYAVETSVDDVTYTAQANVVDGIGTVQSVLIPPNVSARYVRITCTGTVPGVDPSTGASRPTWASFWEVSVLGV